MTNNTAIATLLREYPGDEAWSRFVAAFLPTWSKRADQQSFLSLTQDEELAIVVAHILDDSAKTWFHSPLPATGGATPSAILQSGPAGQPILRSLLMRMPI